MEPKSEFMIPIVDFGALPAVVVPSTSAGVGRSWSEVHGRVLGSRVEALLGGGAPFAGGDPEVLRRRYNF